MAVTRPFRRTVRQFVKGSHSEHGRWGYVKHPQYSVSSVQYIRAFLLLLKDMQELFDYVEPSNVNLKCYSYRIHELLLRACVEVEANCKAIMIENGYALKPHEMTMTHYKKIEVSHRLSAYKVRFPVWHGSKGLRRPFSAWVSGKKLPWYDAYNKTKHSRHDEFQNATFAHMTDAVAGLTVLLSAQFLDEDFAPSDSLLSMGDLKDGMESSIGGYFRVKFPQDWPLRERYDFDWEILRHDPAPFQSFDYSKVP